MTKDFTPPSIESKPLAAVMPTAPDPSFLGSYPMFPFAYPFTGDRNQMFSTTFDNLQQQVYPASAQRWSIPDYQEAKAWIDPLYQMNPFHIPTNMEPYPTDPCPSTTPSTSVAQPQVEYKPLDYNMLRGNPMTPAYYNGMLPYNDFAQAHAMTASWKAAVKGANPSKTGIPPTKHRTGPGTNNVRVRTTDTYRVVYTDAQRTELELEYQSQEFITADRKAELSARLNLTERQVKIWFQNRRAKKRRDSRNKNY